jgi:L-2-hydroxyglutarate oxidase LhgO
LYYEPGSLKASLCVDGGPRLLGFCEKRGIPTAQTGKMVVATAPDQVPALEELERRADANGVTAIRIGPEEIRELEPGVRGIAGLRVPFTGSVDYARVARALADDLMERGSEIRTGARVLSSRQERGSDGHRAIVTAAGELVARLVVNCAGLHVDRVARLLGHTPGLKVLPFRGEYWGLRQPAADRVRGHIYPVPDPRFPHLGVHFTRTVGGGVEVGPNAVWAWGREAYRRSSVSPGDALDTLSYKGFWNLAHRHWRTGAAEQWRSLSRRAFVRNARQLMPDLTTGDLHEWRSGIRAQAVARDGTLIHDFVIQEAPGIVSVINAPSPAATSCLTIGKHIGTVALRHLDPHD